VRRSNTGNSLGTALKGLPTSTYDTNIEMERSDPALIAGGQVRRHTDNLSVLPAHSLLLQDDEKMQREQLLMSLDQLACHVPRTVLDQIINQVVQEENKNKIRSLLQESLQLSEGVTDDSSHSEGHHSVASLLYDSSANSKEEEDPDAKVSKLRQGRLSNSTMKPLMMDSSLLSLGVEGESSHSEADTGAPIDLLPSVESTSALLFIDVSGFTELSRSLEVEQLSKVINSYFEQILEIVHAHQGDVLKFAGDALLVEWRDHQDKKHQQQSSACLLATECASKLVDVCSDLSVKTHTAAGMPDTTLLNIHCAVAYGAIVGTHVGNSKRTEYVVVGDAMKQLSKAMEVAQSSQVVVSPQVIRALEGLVKLSKRCHVGERPVVLACKSQVFYKAQHSPTLLANQKTASTSTDLSRKCEDWTKSMLQHCEAYLDSYVHPATTFSETKRLSFSTPSRPSSMGASEVAELRDVVTVFLQPILPENFDLMSSPVDQETLDLLQQIMAIVQSEVDHFGGQLRQFIVDDKGLVIIFNWGLRGSTFPNMVEERTMPCMRNIGSLLRTELSVKSRMGATAGKAYAGVVGGSSRHEYAVLAPAVNLSARLCFNTKNPGVLVDGALRSSARSSQFRVRKPILAKGYSFPVRIYEPKLPVRKSWVHIERSEFVGRTKEVAELTSLACNMIKGPSKESSKLAFVSGPAGYGKSLLLSRVASTIEGLCKQLNATHVVFRHVFSEDDAFKPFSIIRPLFLNALRQKQSPFLGFANSNGEIDSALQEEMEKQANAQLHLSFLRTCMQASIPMQYVEMLAGLIFSDKLSSDIGQWSDKSRKMSDWNTLVKHFVRIYTELTKDMDLVVLALDDVSGVDEMSWKILQRLVVLPTACRYLVLSADRNQYGLNTRGSFWDELTSNDKVRFVPVTKMTEQDIVRMTKIYMGKYKLPDLEQSNIARSVYLLSEGIPSVADVFLGLYMSRDSDSGDEVKDVLLNRLDTLDTSARLHLQCGAMLGRSFAMKDVVAVMESYNDISVEDEDARASHLALVSESLDEAEQNGFLSVKELAGGEIVLYSFTHSLLKDVVSQQILQEWKDRVQCLIDAIINPPMKKNDTMAAPFNSDLRSSSVKSDLKREVSPYNTKPTMRRLPLRSD